jgi:hypothetical protein
VRSLLLIGITSTIALEAALLALLATKTLEFDPKVGASAAVAIPGFIFTVLALAHTVALQRGAFVKDYIAQFFLRPDFYETWHDLIYRYEDELFDLVDVAAKRHSGTLQPRSGNPVQVVLSAATTKPGDNQLVVRVDRGQLERWSGLEPYHPDFLQGSAVERRLDALLSYLNVVGYYYDRGLISLNDVYGTLGYYLSFMNHRKVISQLIKKADRDWRDPDYQKITPRFPYHYLRGLLSAIDKRNQSLLNKHQSIEKGAT